MYVSVGVCKIVHSFIRIQDVYMYTDLLQWPQHSALLSTRTPAKKKQNKNNKKI